MQASDWLLQQTYDRLATNIEPGNTFNKCIANRREI